MNVIGDRPEINLDTVLFATDLTKASGNAGDYALLLARYFSATVHVVHAFTLSQAALEVEAAKKHFSQQREELQDQLNSIAQRYAVPGVQVQTHLREGDPEEVVPEVARRVDASLIVLGTHGGGRFDRHTIGSVSEAILLSTHRPVLTVGPQVARRTLDALPPRRILYATDLSDSASQAAPYAVSLAESFGAEIDVLNVVTESAVRHPDRWDELSEDFYRKLETVVPEYAREFCDTRTFVEVGRAREQILHHVEERDIDLLVLGIHRSHAGEFRIRTSSVFHMVLEAKCPIWTIAG